MSQFAAHHVAVGQTVEATDGATIVTTLFPADKSAVLAAVLAALESAFGPAVQAAVGAAIVSSLVRSERSAYVSTDQPTNFAAVKKT